MKKILLTFIMLISSLMPAMESKIVIKGNIAIVPGTVYAGQGKITLSGPTIKEILNDQEIKPNDVLQPVWVWTEPPFQSPRLAWGHPIEGKTFPEYLPYHYLEDLKEGALLKITIDGVDYELKANQKGFGWGKNDCMLTFHDVLAHHKKKFDKHPNWFSADKNFLLEEGILGEVTVIDEKTGITFRKHGPRVIQKSNTISKTGVYAILNPLALIGLDFSQNDYLVGGGSKE